jgi:hypothetical protein
VPLCADDHRRILHPPAIREDIIVVPSAIVALGFVGASIRTVSSLLVLERVAQSLIAVCFILTLIINTEILELPSQIFDDEVFCYLISAIRYF